MTEAWAETVAQGNARKRKARRIALVVATGILVALIAIVAIGPSVTEFVDRLAAPPPPVVEPGNRAPSGQELLTLPTASEPVIPNVWMDWSFDRTEGPVVLDDTWVLTTTDRASSLSAVELATGETRWTLSGVDVAATDASRRELRTFLHLYSLRAPTPVVVATSAAGISDDRVVAIDGSTGALTWQSETGARYVGALADGRGSFLVSYAAEGLRTTIQRIAPTSAHPVSWEAVVDGDVAIRGDRLFVFGTTTQVLDAADGTVLESWSDECISNTRGGAGHSAPALVGELLVSFRDGDRVHVCDVNGRELWSSAASAWWPILDDWGQDAERPVATSQLLVARTEAGVASLSVLDLADGAEVELDVADRELPPIDTVLRVGDRLIVAATSHTDGPSLTVVDALTGAQLWDAAGSYLRSVSRTAVTVTRAGDELDGTDGTIVGLALENGEQLWETSWGGEVPYYLGTHAFLWGANGVFTPLTFAG